MPTITLEYLGAFVVGFIVILGAIKYFIDWSDRKSQKDADLYNKYTDMNEKFNSNLTDVKQALTENTVATRSTREYLERVELQHNQKFKEHDKRLDSLDNKVDEIDKEVVKNSSKLETLINNERKSND